ncbi:IS3 family transposase [Myceligenerans halotolerans]
MAGFITSQRAEYRVPVATSCRALEVSQAWYYKWAHGDPSPRHARRARLAVEVARRFAARRGRDGSPRITAWLRRQGWKVSENTVAQVMRENGLVARAPRRRKNTTRQARANRWYAPDLVERRFDAGEPDRLWFGDGTQLATGEGKLYLYSVLDMYARRVLGFAISARHDREVAERALAMAVAVRGGRDALEMGRLILHTDRGGEFTACDFRAACERMHITQSMGRPGSALDNSVLEAWHSTLTRELRAWQTWPTFAAARQAVAAFVDDYNHDRLHTKLGMRSPIEFETGRLNQPDDTRREAA